MIAAALRWFRRLSAEMRDAAQQALRSLFAHRLRSALTIAGITIGVGTVIGIYSVIAGLDAKFAEQLGGLGPSTLYVSSRPWITNANNWWKFRNRPVVGQQDLRALEDHALLPLAIAPVGFAQAVVAQGEKELKNIHIRGTTDKFLETGGWQIKRGRFLSLVDHELGSDACVIGADLEDAFFKNREAVGQSLRVGPFTRCTVVGAFVRRGNAFGMSQDALLVLPLSAFRRAFGQKRGLMLAVVAPMDKITETEEEVGQVLRMARRLRPDQEDNFSVNRQDKMISTFNQTTLALKVVAGFVGLITLVVGGIGIMNILLVSVKERTREIGIRRAVGARRSTILLQFLCEAVAVSCVGGLFGTALGVGAAQIVAIVTPLWASAAPKVVLLGVGFSAVTGLIFGIWPAWTAAALHPIEALRYE